MAKRETHINAQKQNYNLTNQKETEHKKTHTTHK